MEEKISAEMLQSRKGEETEKALKISGANLKTALSICSKKKKTKSYKSLKFKVQGLKLMFAVSF